MINRVIDVSNELFGELIETSGIFLHLRLVD